MFSKLEVRLYNIIVILLYVAIAFGVNWMAYEQKRANSGIFIDPQALSAPQPSQPPQAPPATSL